MRAVSRQSGRQPSCLPRVGLGHYRTMSEPVADRPDLLSGGFVLTRRADAPVRVVAGGNHVTSLLMNDATDGVLDAIKVRADPGGGPPPHRHSFSEWFFVQEGTLQITGSKDDRMEVVATLHSGDSLWVPPGVWHGTANDSDAPAEFLVVGVPGVMTGYFAQAGVVVPDDVTPPATPPPGPAELADLAARFDITFFAASEQDG